MASKLGRARRPLGASSDGERRALVGDEQHPAAAGPVDGGVDVVVEEQVLEEHGRVGVVRRRPADDARRRRRAPRAAGPDPRAPRGPVASGANGSPRPGLGAPTAMATSSSPPRTRPMARSGPRRADRGGHDLDPAGTPAAARTRSASVVNRSASAGPVGRSPYQARSNSSDASANASPTSGNDAPHLARGTRPSCGRGRRRRGPGRRGVRPATRSGPAWPPSTGPRPRAGGPARPRPPRCDGRRRRRRARRRSGRRRRGPGAAEGAHGDHDDHRGGDQQQDREPGRAAGAAATAPAAASRRHRRRRALELAHDPVDGPLHERPVGDGELGTDEDLLGEASDLLGVGRAAPGRSRRRAELAGGGQLDVEALGAHPQVEVEQRRRRRRRTGR